jgi:hypothetical protein
MSSKRRVPVPAASEKVEQLPVEIDLPQGVYKGIGKIISIHALLETVVSDLVYILMKITAAEGRTALGYRSAGEQFKLIRKLLDLRGIAPADFNINAISDQIDDCCTIRDQMAHGIWVRRNGFLGLRLTKGGFQSEEGYRSRAITPEGIAVPPEYYEQAREIIKSTIAEVQHFTVAVKAAVCTENPIRAYRMIESAKLVR